MVHGQPLRTSSARWDCEDDRSHGHDIQGDQKPQSGPKIDMNSGKHVNCPPLEGDLEPPCWLMMTR